VSARAAGATTMTGTLGSGSSRVAVTTLSAPVTLLQRGQPPCPPDGVADGPAGSGGA
jgi:hypothetical protein